MDIIQLKLSSVLTQPIISEKRAIQITFMVSPDTHTVNVEQILAPSTLFEWVLSVVLVLFKKL